MAFEKGNQLAVKSKLFDGALRRAIAQDDGKRLRQAAEALLDAAAAGEPWAIDKLADRLDGKPGQTVDMRVSKQPGEMTLAELTAELAAAAGRSTTPGESADKSGELH